MSEVILNFILNLPAETNLNPSKPEELWSFPLVEILIICFFPASSPFQAGIIQGGLVGTFI